MFQVKKSKLLKNLINIQKINIHKIIKVIILMIHIIIIKKENIKVIVDILDIKKEVETEAEIINIEIKKYIVIEEMIVIIVIIL